MGDRLANLKSALEIISKLQFISVLSCSSVYESKPQIPDQGEAQGPYLNAALEISTSLSPEELLAELKRTESKLGRPAKRQKNSPRTLDLDIVFYDDLIMMTDELEIPHPRLAERRFVLAPIAEIAPNQTDPTTGKSVSHLLKSLDASGKGTYTSVICGPLWPLGGNDA